jgi:hypothetical protein
MNAQLISLFRSNPFNFILHDLIRVEIGRHYDWYAIIHVFVRV